MPRMGDTRMNRFVAIVAERFALSPEQVTGSLTAQEVAEWDSMNFLLLIADLEKEFNVSFTMDEVLSVESLDQMQTLLVGKGAIL